MNKENSVICCLLCLFGGLLAGLCLGQYFLDIDRTKAIKANVAEYQVEKKTGVTKFVYKNCEEVESKVILIPTEE